MDVLELKLSGKERIKLQQDLAKKLYELIPRSGGTYWFIIEYLLEQAYENKLDIIHYEMKGRTNMELAIKLQMETGQDFSKTIKLLEKYSEREEYMAETLRNQIIDADRIICIKEVLDEAKLYGFDIVKYRVKAENPLELVNKLQITVDKEHSKSVMYLDNLESMLKSFSL